MANKMCGCGCKMRSGGMCMKCGGTPKMQFGGTVRKFADGGEIDVPAGAKIGGNEKFMIKRDLNRLRDIKEGTLTDEEHTAMSKEFTEKYGEESEMKALASVALMKGAGLNEQSKDVTPGSVNKRSITDIYGDFEPMKYVLGKSDSVSDESLNMLTQPVGSRFNKAATSSNTTQDAKSGPVKGGNMGRLSAEQVKLNKLIAADGGTALAEDDVIGAKTREAMVKYEAAGKYKTPALFSVANVAQYKKNIEAAKTAPTGAKTTTTGNASTPKSEKPVADNVIGNINEGKSKSLFGQAGEMFAKEIASTRDRKQVATSEAKYYDVEKGDYVYEDKKTAPKVTNEENLKKAGLVKVPTEGVRVLDGDTIEWNGKRIRIGGIEGNKKGTSYLDAAEASQPNKVGGDGYADGKVQLEKAISSLDSMYINPNGDKDDYGRIISPVYYGSTDGIFHAADSLGSVKGNAMFGDGDKYPKSDRQKMIEGKNESKYSDNYDQSPSAYRKEQEAKKGKTPLANVPKAPDMKGYGVKTIGITPVASGTYFGGPGEQDFEPFGTKSVSNAMPEQELKDLKYYRDVLKSEGISTMYNASKSKKLTQESITRYLQLLNKYQRLHPKEYIHLKDGKVNPNALKK